MLLTYIDLVDLIDHGVITDVPVGNINPASIDLRLGKFLMIEDTRGKIVNLTDKTDGVQFSKHDLVEEPVQINPGGFFLAQTIETFNFPNDIAGQFKLKSSQARSGLEFLAAGWIDPGFNGSVLTLPMKNCTQNHPFVLKYGMKIGQVNLYRGKCVPRDNSYAVVGQYNNDKEVQASKGIR